VAQRGAASVAPAVLRFAIMNFRSFGPPDLARGGDCEPRGL
jgi:hypothetical protein